MPTPKLVLNRDHTLTSIYGHSIHFVKGIPTHVPPVLHSAALSIGALPSEGEELIEEDKPVAGAPVDPAERSDLILAAINTLVDRNERDDFTAAGIPSVKAVSALLGWKVQGNEIGPVWQRYNDEKAGV